MPSDSSASIDGTQSPADRECDADSRSIPSLSLAPTPIPTRSPSSGDRFGSSACGRWRSARRERDRGRARPCDAAVRRCRCRPLAARRWRAAGVDVGGTRHPPRRRADVAALLARSVRPDLPGATPRAAVAVRQLLVRPLAIPSRLDPRRGWSRARGHRGGDRSRSVLGRAIAVLGVRPLLVGFATLFPVIADRAGRTCGLTQPPRRSIGPTGATTGRARTTSGP